jgi:hypothetical protein
MIAPLTTRHLPFDERMEGGGGESENRNPFGLCPSFDVLWPLKAFDGHRGHSDGRLRGAAVGEEEGGASRRW